MPKASRLLFRPARRALAAILLPAMLVPISVPAAENDHDLWNRLCDGRGLLELEHPSIDEAARRYTASPLHFQRLLARGEPYLWHVLEAIEEREMPTEIALLPAVESGFDPHIRSGSAAVGLWQFMRPTAERFGLRMTGWYDGRADVIASTRAALDYLGYLHDLFDDWWLSLAAYNVGEGRVAAEQRRLREAGLRRVFWKMELPAETRGHVPRLLGMARAVCEPERYGVVRPSLANHATTRSVEFPGQVSLHRVAEWAGVSAQALYETNPAILGTTTDPEGPHHLLIPASLADRVASRAARADPSELRRYERYRVVRGDTLSAIAWRHRSNVGELRALNRLNSDVIRLGASLIVPVPEARPVPSGAHPGRDAQEYIVRRGDSLWSIARRHGVSVDEVARWNGLGPDDVLSLGRRLMIWAAGTPG